MKALAFASTTSFHKYFGEHFSEILIKILILLFRRHPFDMFVFEPSDSNNTAIRLAGYNFVTGELDETTIILTLPITIARVFWLKIDDYNDFYLGTFLFPEEY